MSLFSVLIPLFQVQHQIPLPHYRIKADCKMGSPQISLDKHIQNHLRSRKLAFAILDMLEIATARDS